MRSPIILVSRYTVEDWINLCLSLQTCSMSIDITSLGFLEAGVEDD